MKVFYVYEHWRPDTGECFYVGKGKDGRAFKFKHRGNNSHYARIISKLEREGLKVDVRIVRHGLAEDEALKLEVERIARHRGSGVVLANITNGGEGTAGMKLTPEHRAKIGAAGRGRIDPPEVKERKKEAARKRPPLSPEARAKIAATMRKKWEDAEYHARMSEAHKEYVFTDEHREALRVANSNKPPRTKEHNAKISDGLRRAHAQRKLAG